MSTKSIKNYIDVDVKYNVTPDLPTLRYNGCGIPVFIWDDLQDYSTISAVLQSLPMQDCYLSVYPTAITCNKYIPWYNMDDSRDSFAAYCLEEHEDLALLEVPGYTVDTPLQMRGKVVRVSLEALRELDMYYENNHIFSRQKIKVFPSAYNKLPLEVYTWFNNVDQISSFDTQNSEYILDKNIDLTPFRSKSATNGSKFYEM